MYFTGLIVVLISTFLVVTVFSNMDDTSIVYALNQTQPDVLIVDKSSFKRIINLIDSIGSINNFIVIGKNVGKSSALVEKGIKVWPYDEIVKLGATNNSSVISVIQPAPDDLAVIMYTSGSSGRPKGFI